MTNDRRFYPRQKVRVVPEPTECIWGWVDAMDQLCGKECTIKNAAQIGDDWYIFLYEDYYGLAWDANCFIGEEDLAVSIEGLNNLL